MYVMSDKLMEAKKILRYLPGRCGLLELGLESKMAPGACW